MPTCGIDCGSESLKVVLLEDDEFVWTVLPYGQLRTNDVARRGLQTLLERKSVSLEEINSIISTGVGRKDVQFATGSVPEIACLAKASNFLFPSVKTAVDLGAKNLMLVRCEGGRVIKFLTNSRCASGTGMFLKMASSVLRIRMEDFDPLFSRSKSYSELQSTCAVFAESELISRLHEGTSVEDLARGVILAVVNKISSSLNELGAEEPILFTGGVSRIRSIKDLLVERIKMEIVVPENPLIVVALGAALIGREKNR